MAGSTTTVYVFSGSKVIAEYVNGALSKEYVYAGSSLLATLNPDGSVASYEHPDHLSTRVETDAAGVVTRTFGQYPFGEVWYETGAANKWKFTSYERDGESGLDYAISRYNSSRLGRFMSPDPLAGSVGNPQSLNRYAYVANDPINKIDPLGLKTFPEDLYGGGSGGARIYLALLASRPGQFGSTWNEFTLLERTETLQRTRYIRGDRDEWEETVYTGWLIELTVGGGGDGGVDWKKELQEVLKSETCAKQVGGSAKVPGLLKNLSVQDTRGGWLPNLAVPGQLEAANALRQTGSYAATAPYANGWILVGSPFFALNQPQQLTVLIHELQHHAFGRYEEPDPRDQAAYQNYIAARYSEIATACGTQTPKKRK